MFSLMKHSLDSFTSFLLPIKCFEQPNKQKEEKEKPQDLWSTALSWKQTEKKIKTLVTVVKL